MGADAAAGLVAERPSVETQYQWEKYYVPDDLIVRVIVLVPACGVAAEAAGLVVGALIVVGSPAAEAAGLVVGEADPREVLLVRRARSEHEVRAVASGDGAVLAHRPVSSSVAAAERGGPADEEHLVAK